MDGGFLNINGGEFLLLALLALLLVGPERLPAVAKQARDFIRKAVLYMRDAKNSLTEEFGEEMADLREFDPRQYDPRRIVREALSEPSPQPPTPRRDPETPAPYDDEAT